jgi:hypothetical protein
MKEIIHNPSMRITQPRIWTVTKWTGILYHILTRLTVRRKRAVKVVTGRLISKLSPKVLRITVFS